MSKFGKKFTCWKCSAKFYDLNKPSAKCPKCGADPSDDPHKGMALAPLASVVEEEPELDEAIAEDPAEEEEEEAAEEEVVEPDDY